VGVVYRCNPFVLGFNNGRRACAHGKITSPFPQNRLPTLATVCLGESVSSLAISIRGAAGGQKREFSPLKSKSISRHSPLELLSLVTVARYVVPDPGRGG
jgi:hypothetical protein